MPDAKALASLEECKESLEERHQPINWANSIPGKIRVTCSGCFHQKLTSSASQNQVFIPTGPNRLTIG